MRAELLVVLKAELMELFVVVLLGASLVVNLELFSVVRLA